MISTQKNFLFIHMPKTGGNSLQTLLAQYSDDRIAVTNPMQDGVERFEIRHERYPSLHKHSTLNEYRKTLPSDVFERLFKFAVVRNPWERMISLFFSPHRCRNEWDRAEFAQMVRMTPRARTHLALRTPSRLLWTALGRKSALDADLDVVIRFETLDRDFGEVCRRLGIPSAPLPRRNESARRHYASYYDDELVKLVESRFSEEIENFGYRFGDADVNRAPAESAPASMSRTVVSPGRELE